MTRRTSLSDDEEDHSCRLREKEVEEKDLQKGVFVEISLNWRKSWEAKLFKIIIQKQRKKLEQKLIHIIKEDILKKETIYENTCLPQFV